MGGQFGKPEPIIIDHREAQPPPTSERTAVELVPLPEELDLGDVYVGSEKTENLSILLRSGSGALVTTLSTPPANTSKPSAFRDKLGLDPEPLRAKEGARSFQLASPAMVSIADDTVPLKFRFQPTRAGNLSAIATIKVVGSDGSFATKRIRLVGTGIERIVNEVRAPDVAKNFEPIRADRPLLKRNTAAETAEHQATRLAERQAVGVGIAKAEVESFKKAAPPRSEWSWLIDLAVSMGVGGLAGLVSKLVTKHVAAALAKNATLNRQQGPVVRAKLDVEQNAAEKAAQGKAYDGPSSDDAARAAADGIEEVKSGDAFQALVADTVKEGFKTIGKKGIPGGAASQDETEVDGGGQQRSANEQIDFFAKHELAVLDLKDSYLALVSELSTRLSSEAATTALMALAHTLHEASYSAPDLQARATGYQWISATAQRNLGVTERELRDGSSHKTTNLDGALDFGERGPLAVSKGTVPKHDGVLDVHVTIPDARTPAETQTLEIKSASLTGISDEIAERIRTTDLAAAGIPIRFIVHGHDALITRDEIGNVRVFGFLRTQDGTNWSEAHMHKGARMIVSRVLAKTLADWGVKRIKTNDATGIKPVGT